MLSAIVVVEAMQRFVPKNSQGRKTETHTFPQSRWEAQLVQTWRKDVVLNRYTGRLSVDSNTFTQGCGQSVHIRSMPGKCDDRMAR